MLEMNWPDFFDRETDTGIKMNKFKYIYWFETIGTNDLTLYLLCIEIFFLIYKNCDKTKNILMV